MLVINSLKNQLSSYSQNHSNRRSSSSKFLYSTNHSKTKKLHSLVSSKVSEDEVHTQIDQVFEKHKVHQDEGSPEERMKHAVIQIISAFNFAGNKSEIKEKIQVKVNDFLSLQEKFPDHIPADFELEGKNLQTWNKIVDLVPKSKQTNS